LLGSFRSGYTIEISEPDRAGAALTASGIEAMREGDLVAVPTDDGETVARTLAGAGLYPRELRRRSGRLEELFLSLTQNDR
jgi:hypothetical protein